MDKIEKFDPRSHIGEIHGIYKIVDVLNKKDKYGHWIYKGVCQECRYVKYSHYGDFSGEKSKATICNHVDANGNYIKPVQWLNKRIGHIFKGMKSRCYNPNDKAYRWYGEKGIKICDEWINNPKLFEEWALNNGYEDNLTIDRLDENKDYCPENCVWITNIDNSKYKSTTSLIDVDNQIYTGREWSEKLGLGTNIINTYIRKYGRENTKEFIRRFLNNPEMKFKIKPKQSYYKLYMNNQDLISF